MLASELVLGARDEGTLLTGTVLRGGRTGGEQLNGSLSGCEMGRPVSLHKETKSKPPPTAAQWRETITPTYLVYLFRVIETVYV